MPKPSDEQYPVTDYWRFTQLGAWDFPRYVKFIQEFAKMDGKPYNKLTQAEFMKNLEQAGFYKPTKLLTEEERKDKWGKYESIIYYLGIGCVVGQKNVKKFQLSGVSKYFLRTNDFVDFLRTQMLRFQYPHGSLKEHDLKLFFQKHKQILPFVFTLQILDKLADKNFTEAYLSKGEILTIVETAKNNNEVGLVVSKILENRKNNIIYNLIGFPPKVVDSINRLFPFFAGTGLCEFNRKDDIKTVFVKDKNQLDEIKLILRGNFQFYKFKRKSQWDEYYQREPSIIPQKEIQELVSIKNEDKAIEELKKLESQVPQNKKKIFNKELLNLLDKNSIGRHKRRRHKKGKIERIRNYPLYEMIKADRNYICQLCRKESFPDRNGNNYVEAHHIIAYNDDEDGPDRINNILVLCPNCHAKFTYANESDIIKAYKELREKGEIKLEQFQELIKEKDIKSHQIKLLESKGIISDKETELFLKI